MIKEVVRPVKGFEAIYAELESMREHLEADKEIAKAEALAKVDNDFAERESKIADAIGVVSVVEEVEVPEENEAEDGIAEEGEEVEGETAGEDVGIA